MTGRGTEAVGAYRSQVPEPDRVPAPSPTELPPFQEVYAQYFDFVWATGTRFGIGPSEIEDLVQDIFMVVHAKLHTIENPAALRSWIYGVVRRTASNHRRARKSQWVASTDDDKLTDYVALGPTPLEETERNAERSLLLDLLNQLDEPKREVFALVDIHELSVPEAAELLGIPLNTAYSRLRVARQAFEIAVARYEASSKAAG